jgi:multicomponent Na+:H+ antiporter subunit E
MNRPPVERPKRVQALRRRLGKVQIPIALGMTLVWMLLFDGFELREESLGLLVLGFGVSVLIMLVFPLPPVSEGFHFHPWQILRLLVHFFSQMVLSSFQVTWQTFSRGPVYSSVVAVRLRTDSELMLVCTSIALSVIPGSVVVEVGQPEHVLYVHHLGTQDASGAARARMDTWRLEERIVRALGSREDIAKLEAAEAVGTERV